MSNQRNTFVKCLILHFIKSFLNLETYWNVVVNNLLEAKFLLFLCISKIKLRCFRQFSVITKLSVQEPNILMLNVNPKVPSSIARVQPLMDEFKYDRYRELSGSIFALYVDVEGEISNLESINQ
jgi:hypothetical protein